MTRIESGVIHPQLDWCDNGRMNSERIELAADGVQVTPITSEINKNLPIVKVDQALLEQCLCNLLLNAASNSQPGTKIIVRARVVHGQLILSVIDQGKGIPEADLPRIFE